MVTTPTNRILIVEDDPTVRGLMTTHFRRSGFQVEYAMAAEEVAADEPYDVVLTDVHLPGESGLDLARRFRQAQPDASVVFVTGDSDRSLARDAIETGAAGYLLKPFELFELDAAVNSALRQRPVAPRFQSIAPLHGGVLPGPASQQNCQVASWTHKHVTAPARVLLSPRISKRHDTGRKLRIAGTVVALTVAAAGIGALLKPAAPIAPSVEQIQVGNKPIVVPVVMDRTVYLNR